jgi:hypothetical protein
VRGVLPASKTADGSGRLKVVNTGIKVLEANPTPPQPGHVYRVPQDGAVTMVPFLSRGVVWASGKELHTVLRFRGQQVPPALFSKRLQAAMEPLPVGSFVLALAPALDGYEDGVGPAGAAAAAADGSGAAAPEVAAYPAACALHTVIDVGADRCTLTPKAIIPASAMPAVPPSLVVNYVPSAAAGGGSNLTFAPAVRAWTGPDPLSRVVVAMWKGRGR